jgi:S-DNA-T family DNA segregation ATPase FtsK/SpoIIIE
LSTTAAAVAAWLRTATQTAQVRIELTVRCGDRQADVLVEAPAQAAVATLVPGLAGPVGAQENAPLWHGAQPLDPATQLGAAGLRIGSVLTFGARAVSPAARPSVLALHVVGGPGAGVIVPLERGRLTIGRAPGCDLVLTDPDVSRRHALLEVTAAAIVLTDLDSTNGTVVDGRHLRGETCVVRAGCLISLGDSVLSVAGPVETPAVLQPGCDGTHLVLRPPRRQHVVPQREITVPTRASGGRPRGVQWVAALIPAAAGCAIAWLAHAPQFLIFTLLSPVMIVSAALGDRLHWRRSRRRDAATFRRRRAEAEGQIAAGLASEAETRRAAAPDPAALLRQATLPGSRLWERHRCDPDFLRLRVGTADLASTLTMRDGAAVAPAGVVAAVPLCVELRRGPVGVAGPSDVRAALARWLVGQLAALHSPADLELALLLTSERCADWAWARWLPHLRDRVATCATEWSALVDDLAALIEQRSADRRGDLGDWRGAWLVLVTDRTSGLAELPGLGALLARGTPFGVTAVCVDGDAAALPAPCAAVARVVGVTGTRLRLRLPDATDTEAVIDQVAPDWVAELARSLAPLVDASASGTASVPPDCPLLETLGVTELTPFAVAARWAESTGGARMLLGRSAEGVLEVDLATDGPHALVAGTTGAGKSELLRSLVASLAANHPPDELNLLLIDYKGGAAFADCARLPHSAGMMTDLDAYLTERALRSLDSELRRRERLFAQAGVSDLTSYRDTAPSEPISRLVIVVDEFAALADELPAFVGGLVGVAQRGRSLGVHLVLATQRPAGAVSAEIRANTAVRVALRMTDPGESRDVIDSPLACTVDRSTPGRAYVRIGTALTCFQAPYASGVSLADPARVDVRTLGPWRRRTTQVLPDGRPTDLTRLVDAVLESAEQFGRSTAHRPWLPPLPDALPRAALDVLPPLDSVALGWIDLPDEQRRATLSCDLAAGTALLVAGCGRSGRTGALLSLAVGAAERLPPERLYIHVVDLTGALAGALGPLPHCATVIGPEDGALAPRLLRRLESEAARRFAQPAAHPVRPHLLLLVDGWDTLCGALPDLNATLCSEALTGLLRVGAAAGISVAVTGDRSVLAPRFAAGFTERVLLRLTDRNDYGLAGIGARDLPATLPPGRGVRATDRAVVQFAHVGARPDRDEFRGAVDSVAAAWAGHDLGADAIRIRALPAHIAVTDLPAEPGRLALGVAGDRLDPVAVDLFAGEVRLLVAGPPRSGRTTVLRLLARQAQAAGISTLVAATSRSPLAEEARRLDIPLVGPAADIGGTPEPRTLLLVDDSETFAETAAGDRLTTWLRSCDAPLAAVVAGRADELATTFRGLAAEVRRSRCGILLRPGPVDGELLGVRLPRRAATGPPGRGVMVGDPSWGPPFDEGEPVPIQVAAP